MVDKLTKPKTEKKIKANVSDKKKKMLKELVHALLNNHTIMVTSIRRMPCSQFQTIKKKLKDLNKTEARVIKKKIMLLAMEEAAKTKLKIRDIEKYLEEGEAVLFSNSDAFELSRILADNKVSVKAKAGQEASEDLTVEAGPTDIPAGPMISELSEVGIKVKVENGKLTIMKDTVIVKKGEKIKANAAAILSKLDIMPFKIGLIPLAAYDSREDKVFENIKVDKEETLKQIILASTQAMNLAINSNYPCKETIIFLIGKAAREANSIEKLIQTNQPKTKKPVESQTQENKEQIQIQPNQESQISTENKINSQGG